jgi:hypothetical protein
MGIELNQPVVIANNQKIECTSIILNKNEKGWCAEINFSILNEEGQQIGKKSIEYKEEEFNNFWSNFNSGKYLYDELINKNNLQINSSEELEHDFENVQEI